jgi:cytochrome c556
MKSINTVAIAVLLYLSLTGTGLAHPPALSNEMLAYVKRDGLMHLINAQRYILFDMLVGKTEVNQDEFVRATRSLAAMFSMIPSTFKDNLMVDESRAKPEIWDNWEDFISRAEELRLIAEEISVMAEIQGAEAALEKVRLFNCGNCHDYYRK